MTDPLRSTVAALRRAVRWLISPHVATRGNTIPTSDEARRHTRPDGTVDLDAVIAERNRGMQE